MSLSTANRQLPTTSFPATRLRRTRRTAWLRELVRETALEPGDLIWPLFVHDEKESAPVAALPGVERLSLKALVDHAKQAKALGIPAIALFPATDPKLKTPDGKEALNKDNLICRAIREVKFAVPELGIIADVALDPYTAHGHDGIVHQNDVDNDATLRMLTQQAVVLADAGADIVAPSDMMDGRVGAIRGSLDQAGHTQVCILAYSAKYASAFYGPFREAVGSKTALGKTDKRTYQMDPGNGDEAMREMAMDIAEGADMVMVKPGLPYLDIIYRAANEFSVPVFAYQVSGEYAMIAAAAKAGSLDAEECFTESMICLKRAGARAIFTYAAASLASHMA